MGKRGRGAKKGRALRLAAKRTARAFKQRQRGKSAISGPEGSWLLIKAPKALTFRRSDNDATVAFLHRIYEQVVVQGRRATVDLSGLAEMSMGGALALVAELNRAQVHRPGHIVRGIQPRRRRLHAILNQMGFFAATTPNVAAGPVQEDGLLRVHSGFAKDIEDTGFLEEFLSSVFPPEVMTDRVRRRLMGAVTEALLNVVDHAYSSKRSDQFDPVRGRWWICGWADPQEGCHFVVYDLGAGIPSTVPDTLAEGVREAYELLEDENRSVDFELIKVAVRHPSSRTGTPGRGRGLPEMRRLIDRVGDGMLWITSGRGHYMYARGEQKFEDGFSMNYRLHGTLVVWRLKITDALDDAGSGDG